MSKRLHISISDITEQDVDVIVNSANSYLRHGGGVARAIADAAGPVLYEECLPIDFVPTGTSVVTSAGNLPCKNIIHTVGPMWIDGENDEEQFLAAAYESAISLTEAHGAKSIAFPSISTGVFGYPVDLAAEVAIRTVSEALSRSLVLEDVRFCLFSDEDLTAYVTASRSAAKDHIEVVIK